MDREVLALTRLFCKEDFSRSQAEKEEETRICRKGVGLGSGRQMGQLMASSPGKELCPEETPT